MSKIRLAGIVEDSIVDGPGIRLTVFTQGCLHNCPGCHNPESHALDGGYMEDCDKIIQMVLSNPLYAGITFSGGDPILQIEQVIYIAKEVKKHHLNTILYTGYLFEQVVQMAKNDSRFDGVFDLIDYIVDGPFINSQRDLTLHFKGSTNQRTIDVKKSISQGEIVQVTW